MGDAAPVVDEPRVGEPFIETYLPYLLRRADQTLSAPFYAVLDDYGIARSDWRVLAVLHERGAMTVVELAAAALSPQPTVTHALRRLEARHLVVRTHGTLDKRQRVVSITPAGSTLADALFDEARRLEAEALADASGVADLVARLRSVTATVEAHVAARVADARSAG